MSKTVCDTRRVTGTVWQRVPDRQTSITELRGTRMWGLGRDAPSKPLLTVWQICKAQTNVYWRISTPILAIYGCCSCLYDGRVSGYSSYRKVWKFKLKPMYFWQYGYQWVPNVGPSHSPWWLRPSIRPLIPKSGQYTLNNLIDMITKFTTNSLQLVGWLSGRTSVSDKRTFTGLHRTCSWWV